MPFDIGFFELLVILVVALVVLGPERLPKATYTIGRWIGKAKRGFSQFNQQVSRELEIEAMKKRIAEHERLIMEQAQSGELKQLREQAQATLEKAEQALKEQQDNQPESDPPSNPKQPHDRP